jgi:hypothetical protein
MTLSVSSQIHSTDSVIVPIQSLRNALLVKNERDYLKTELNISRDSINSLNNIVITQDSIINICDSTINILFDNIENYKQVINVKDTIIDIKNKQINKSKQETKFFKGTTIITLLILLIL